MKWKIIIIVLAGIVFGTIYAYRDLMEEELLALVRPTDADPVPTLKAEPRDYAISTLATGELTGLESIPIDAPRTRMGSLKLAWIVDEGTAVHPGDTLIRFDSTEANLKLIENQNTVTSYDYQLSKADENSQTEHRVLNYDLEGAEREVNFSVNQIRKDETIFSRWEIQESLMNADLARFRRGVLEDKGGLRGDQSKAEHRILEIEQEKARYEVDTAQETLASLALKTQINGVVLYKRSWWRSLAPGTEVWPGQRLLEIASLDKFQGKVHVVETEISGIEVDQPVQVTLNAIPGQVFSGHVTKVGRAAEQRDRDDPRKYFTCDILMDVPPELMTKLKPGMSVEARIQSGTFNKAFVLPKSAVIKRESDFVVFVTDGTEKYREIPVKILDSDHGFFLVEGIQAGQEVCLRHPYDDQTLHLPDFNAPSSASRSERFVMIFN